MPNPIDNVTLTGTGYQAAATISSVWGGNGGSFSISGGDVYYRLQYPTPNPGSNPGGFGTPQYTPEVRIGQGPGIIPPGVSGVEFRNVSSALPATVTAIIAEPNAPFLILSAPSALTPSGAVTFLGSYTVAQWPPQNPTEGDVALFADTYNGLTFSWLLQYQPSALGTTYPWGPPAGVTLGYNWKNGGSLAGYWFQQNPGGWIYTGNANVAAAGFTQQVPRAGIYGLAGYTGGYDAVATADTIGIGLSSTTTVAPIVGNYGQQAINAAGRGGVAFTGGTLTLAAAATIYTWVYVGSTNVVYFPSLTLGIVPTQIA